MRTTVVLTAAVLLLGPLAAAQQQDEATRKLDELLDTKRVSVEFVDTSFGDAMSFVRALLGVNIVVSPEVKTDQRVTLTVQDMTARAALRWMAGVAGATMEVKDGTIYVKPDPKRVQRAMDARRGGTIVGKAQVRVGEAASLDVYLYDDELPAEVREKLVALLRARLKAALAKAAGDQGGDR